MPPWHLFFTHCWKAEGDQIGFLYLIVGGRTCLRIASGREGERVSKLAVNHPTSFTSGGRESQFDYLIESDDAVEVGCDEPSDQKKRVSVRVR